MVLTAAKSNRMLQVSKELLGRAICYFKSWWETGWRAHTEGAALL